MHPSSRSLRSQATDPYASFPFCKCESDTTSNPVRLIYKGLEAYPNGTRFLQFAVTLAGDVARPPVTPTTCSGSDIGKIEFSVGRSKRREGCFVTASFQWGP